MPAFVGRLRDAGETGAGGFIAFFMTGASLRCTTSRETPLGGFLSDDILGDPIRVVDKTICSGVFWPPRAI